MLHVPPPTNQPVSQQIRSVLQVAKSCCRKSDSSSTSCNKIFTLCCAFYLPKTNLYCSKWPRSRVWCDSRVILSNQKRVFTKLATSWFVSRQVFATPPPPSEVFFLVFFFQNDKTSAADVLSSCSFIPHAHFETSLVMVSYYSYEIWHHK